MSADKWIETQHYLLTGRDTLPGGTHQPGRPDQVAKSKDTPAAGTMPNPFAKLTDYKGSNQCLQILQQKQNKNQKTQKNPQKTKEKHPKKQNPKSQQKPKLQKPPTKPQKTQHITSMNHSLTGKGLRIYSTILWSNTQCWAESKQAFQFMDP